MAESFPGALTASRWTTKMPAHCCAQSRRDLSSHLGQKLLEGASVRKTQVLVNLNRGSIPGNARVGATHREEQNQQTNQDHDDSTRLLPFPTATHRNGIVFPNRHGRAHPLCHVRIFAASRTPSNSTKVIRMVLLRNTNKLRELMWVHLSKRSASFANSF